MEWLKPEKNAIADGKKIAKKSAVSQCAVSSYLEKDLALLGHRPPVHRLRYVTAICVSMSFISLKSDQSINNVDTISHVQGPCCTESCQLRYGVKCRDDNGCRDSAFCDGSGPKCPPSNNKANKTVCNEEFVCFMGVCFSLDFQPFFL